MQAKRGKGSASIEAQVVVEKTAQAQKYDQLRLFMGPPIFLTHLLPIVNKKLSTKIL